MRSHAALSSSSPPMTDCSASMECGGTFSASNCGSFDGAFMEWNYRRRMAGCGQRKKAETREGSCPYLLPSPAAWQAGLAANLNVLDQHRHRHVAMHVG